MADAPYKLILLRHGESEWNAKNLFTGWVDVNLNEKGEKEAVRGGELLKDADLLPDVVHTSLQKRAIRTAQLALEAADRHWIPVHRSWRLNERHYGALTGLKKDEAAERFGAEQIARWRRGYSDRPPPMGEADHEALAQDRRYRGVPVPRTESLEDVQARLKPWRAQLDSALSAGPVLVVAHGNSLRALLSDLLRLAPEEVRRLEIPLANPLVAELDDAGQTSALAYLDASRAAALPRA